MLGVASVLLRACAYPKTPTSSLVSLWSFDETEMSAFGDLGPAGVPMTIVGSWADLTIGSMVHGIDGTSAFTSGGGYAKLPAGTPAHALAELTVSFYFQRNSAVDKQILFAAGNGTEAGDFSVEVLANGRLRGWHTGQDGRLRFFEGSDGIVGTNLQVGVAHRVDLSLGRQGARIYLDGGELAAAAISENTNGWNNSREKYLGRWTDGVLAPADGAFDHLQLWNRQLGSADIALLAPAKSVSLSPPSVDTMQLGTALQAFQHTRIQMTALAGWPAGRTPRGVVSQGALAHAYVRRSWKSSENDGTWMDFQAGWRSGTADSIAVRLDDNSVLDISFDVTQTIPSPGAGGSVRTLDKLGGGDFTTWSSAIAALNDNDVLVVRARGGGEVYPSDVNSGGAKSTASGVQVVAHPDDIAAGRRPRIHVQGTKLARYADELNFGHWELWDDLGSPHGKVWRTSTTVGNLVNVGCSYRTADGRLLRCYTYTNTPGTPGALARLRDTAYPRINRNESTWDLYMGPGIYLHSDGRLYIRLTPLSDGIGAVQVNAGANGTNPPWNWDQYAPADTDPNKCQLYISSSNDQNSESGPPTTDVSYVLRINNQDDWSFENLDFVGGGNTIEMNGCNDITFRGCQFLGWAPPNMASEDNRNSTVERVHNMMEAEGTHGIVADRCEFWGGQAPWYGWEENKAIWGAYSVPHKCNVFWMNDGTSDSFSATFRHCLKYGFSAVSRRNGKLRYLKMHHCRWQFCGMDGSLACQVPSQTLEFLRSQIFESSIGGWLNEDSVDGVMHMGYNLIVNVRPYVHDSAYWDTTTSQDNQYCCIRQTIGHGTNPGYKELERQYWFNNTAIGSHNHQRAATTKASGNMSHDGAGAFIFPYNVNRWFKAWWSRNNVLAVFPNGSQGDLTGTRAPQFGDSHVGVVLHQNHVGNAAAGGLEGYSSDYNIYFRHPGMPTLTGPPGNNFNGVVTTVNAGGSESARSTIGQVQSDTGQEANGRFIDPLFIGSWDASKLDPELHANAFWCLGSSSPAKAGGDEIARTWLDVDFGAVTTYGGQPWLGCMDPDASEVEQQVGPLGPMPSGVFAPENPQEYITTPEAHGWDAGKTDLQNTAAFQAAIDHARDGAGSSVTGRGVVELVQGKTYTVAVNANGSSSSSPVNALTAKSNVEIRTEGKPVRGSGNQALIQWNSWDGFGSASIKHRNLLWISQVSNFQCGYVQLSGRKNTMPSPPTLDYTSGADGGMNCISIRNDISNVVLKELVSEHAGTDGLLMSPTSALGVLIEDCTFTRNRRQGLSLGRCNSAGAPVDTTIFRRCEFSDTGDFAGDIAGQKPGAGVDVEPDQTGNHVYGVTFDDCDFANNKGSRWHHGADTGLFSSGHGLVFDCKATLANIKITNCRGTGNRTRGLTFGLREAPTWEGIMIEDYVSSGNGDNSIQISASGSGTGGRVTDMTITNCDVASLLWENGGFPSPWDTGWSVTLWRGNFTPSVTTNGVQTITNNAGFP